MALDSGEVGVQESRAMNICVNSSNRTGCITLVLFSWSVIAILLSGCATGPDAYRVSDYDLEMNHLARADVSDNPDHPWAGVYVTRPDLLVAVLVLSPKIGVVRETINDLPVLSPGRIWHVGEIVGVDAHEVRVDPNRRESEKWLADRGSLLRFAWGDQRFLVLRDSLPELRSDVDRGLSPAESHWAYMHSDDRRNAVAAGTREDLLAALDVLESSAER